MQTSKERRSKIIFLHQEEISELEIARRVKCLRKGVPGVTKSLEKTDDASFLMPQKEYGKRKQNFGETFSIGLQEIKLRTEERVTRN